MTVNSSEIPTSSAAQQTEAAPKNALDARTQRNLQEARQGIEDAKAALAAAETDSEREAAQSLVDYYTDELANLENRVAGSREAAEEARNTAAKLERQRVAAINGEEVNTDGTRQNDNLRKGRSVDVQQRSGREDERLSEGTKRIRAQWETDGAPAETERGSLRYAEKVNLQQYSSTILAENEVYRDVSETQSTRNIFALAEKNGINAGNILLFGVVGDMDGFETVGYPGRAFYNPETDIMGVMTNNKEINGYDLWRHELAEHKIARGDMDAETVLSLAEERIEPEKEKSTSL